MQEGAKSAINEPEKMKKQIINLTERTHPVADTFNNKMDVSPVPLRSQTPTKIDLALVGNSSELLN